jgi:hypothetical protein
MTNTRTDDHKPSPVPRAIFGGLIAGIAAGGIIYLLGFGVPWLIIGFVVGAVVGSRTVLMVAKSREETQ